MNVMQETADLAMQPQPEMIAQALAVIRPHGAILLVSIHPMSHAIVSQSFVMPQETQAAVDWAVAQNEKQAGVYFTVNITTATHKKSTKNDVVQAVAFWSDCDPEVFKFKGYDTARADLLTNVVPRMQKYASYIIDSGNGVDPFFTLATPMTLDGDYAQYEAVNQQVGEVCGGPGTYNCDRVMRLPGTLNFPNDAKIKKGYPQVPSMARMLYVSDKKYTLQEVQALVISLDLQNRFERFLTENITAATRYAGDKSGLTDKSGSAMDFSMVALLKIGGFSIEECMALLANWKHGSSSEQRNGDRYWLRCWERTEAKKPAPAVDFTEMLAKQGNKDQKEAIKVKKNGPVVEIDPALYNPPGIMGSIVEWINTTSSKPQPQFAVQIALATVATIAGRRFKTEYNNWPSIYLMNIGPSACGKEYGKSALEEILEACGCANLIGPSSYTSNSGLLSVLHAQPNHVTVIDEFHRLLESASIKTNERAKSMLTALMEVWGRNDGTIRPQGYSTFGASGKEAAKLQERSIRNPALTLVALGIPQFFETVGSAAVKDGFLNRFLIVETQIGRQSGSFTQTIDVPGSITTWAAETRARYVGMIDPDTNPTMAVTPVILPFSQHARDAFDSFAAENIERMNEYDKKGVSEMFGRTNEMAMKISLICALARGVSEISLDDAQWAISYTRTYSLLVAERLASSVSNSEFETIKNQTFGQIAKRGERGATTKELNDFCHHFKKVDKRYQLNVLESLAFLGKIQSVTFPRKGIGGKQRVAWVAIEEDAE